jgi:hypothetical protein
VARAKAHLDRLRPLLEAKDVRQLFVEWTLVDTKALMDHGAPVGMVETFRSILGQAVALAAEPGQLARSIGQVDGLTAEDATPNALEQSLGREALTVRQLREDLGRLTPVHLAEDLLQKFRGITADLRAWFVAHPPAAQPAYPPAPPKGGGGEPFAETKFNPRPR